MKNVRPGLAATVALTFLSACAQQPIGPTVQVMPAPNKPFNVFAEDEAVCKQYAQGQIAGAVDQANTNAVGAAVIGTALGAGLGAAVGGGRGAAIGAGTGAVVGTGLGAETSNYAQMTIQQRYDVAYSQCMYSKGNQVPGFQPAAVLPPPPPPPPPPPVAAPAPRYDHGLVSSIQVELIRIGLLKGSADGSYGPRTRGAISEYQKVRGMPVDGVPTQNLLDDLKRN